MLDTWLEAIKNNRQPGVEQALELVNNTDLEQLCLAADALRRERHGQGFDLCSIINARSGHCSEDCVYCAQSSRYQVDIDQYSQIESRVAIGQARENEDYGVKRLSLVTAGRSIGVEQLMELCHLYEDIRQNTELFFCASMGLLDSKRAEMLYEAGVRRYHCNLETCREFFPQICTTHTWEEKVKTIAVARTAGMDVCSGGIIGMGESLAQRLQMAFELRDLKVKSIPLNVLTPVPGTPLADITPITLDEVLRCIAMFRLVNPDAVIRMAGGRTRFAKDQCRFFTAGANGAIGGNYLTTAGNSMKEEVAMIRSLGFVMES